MNTPAAAPPAAKPPAAAPTGPGPALQRLTIGTVAWLLHGKLQKQEGVDLTKWENVFGQQAPNGAKTLYPGPNEINAVQIIVPANHYIALEHEVSPEMSGRLHMYANNIEYSTSGLNLAIAGTAGDFNGLANKKNIGNNDTPVLYHRLAKGGRPRNPSILDVDVGAKLVLNIGSANPAKEQTYVIDFWGGN